MLYAASAKNNWTILLKVYNSCIWWCRKTMYISACLGWPTLYNATAGLTFYAVVLKLNSLALFWELSLISIFAGLQKYFVVFHAELSWVSDLALSSPIFCCSSDSVCSARDDVCFQFQGTVIRVFSVPDGQKLFEFRRGVKRSVHVVYILKCLSFLLPLSW